QVMGLVRAWTSALADFVDAARTSGETDSSIDSVAVAEHIVITNLGSAMLSRRVGTEREPARMRYTRLTLKASGFADVDMIADEVLDSWTSGRDSTLPPKSLDIDPR